MGAPICFAGLAYPKFQVCRRGKIISCVGPEISPLSLVRVLIADDEKLFSSVLAEMVRSFGHEMVAVVHSGLDAIRAYRQHNPDVVLMDFAMARLNGLTACRNILSDDPAGCIVFLSGLGERIELTPELSGAFAVLQKPISRARLEQVLEEISTRRQTGGAQSREAVRPPGNHLA